jgi:hypothetical protein
MVFLEDSSVVWLLDELWSNAGKGPAGWAVFMSNGC